MHIQSHQYIHINNGNCGDLWVQQHLDCLFSYVSHNVEFTYILTYMFFQSFWSVFEIRCKSIFLFLIKKKHSVSCLFQNRLEQNSFEQQVQNTNICQYCIIYNNNWNYCKLKKKIKTHTNEKTLNVSNISHKIDNGSHMYK